MHHSFPLKGATDVTKTLRLHWNLEKDRKIIKKESVRKVPGRLPCELNAMFCHFLLSIYKNQTIAEEFFLFTTVPFPPSVSKGASHLGLEYQDKDQLHASWKRCRRSSTLEGFPLKSQPSWKRLLSRDFSTLRKTLIPVLLVESSTVIREFH